MKKGKDILLSLWICISFIIAVAGVIVIEYTILNNTYRDEDIIFWAKLSQTGNILTLIGFISTFLSILITIILPRITKKENIKTEYIKTLTLTKVFAITIVCVSLILLIIDIFITEHTKSIIQTMDMDKIIQLNATRGVFSTLALYAIPIFTIIETIFIFISTKTSKDNTAK